MSTVQPTTEDSHQATSSHLGPDLKSDHYANIENHFDQLAAQFPQYKTRHAYYHGKINQWLRAHIPPARTLLEFGCGVGDLIAQVKPSRGVGIDLAGKMIETARKLQPDYEFVHNKVEDFETDETFDNVLAVNSIDYSHDISEIFKKAYQVLKPSGRLFIVTGNPIWSGIYKWASKVGLRQPDCQRLFLTNLDLVNLLRINGFEVVYLSSWLVCPIHIPLLSNAINWLIRKTPFLRLLGSTQFLIARKRAQLPERDRTVSMIVPCHNEEGNVRACVNEIKKVGVSTEVIFVDDGSTDGTADRVRELQGLRQDIHVELISYQPNQGKGHAVKAGLDRASGNVLLILDADLSTRPDELGAMCNIIFNGHADFVNCTRMIYPMESKAMKTLNYVGNKMFTILVSLIMERRVSDTLCGTKIFFKKDYAYFRMGRDPWGDYDLLFGAAKLRLAMAEFPVHYRDRLEGNSKMRSFAHGMNLLRMCLIGYRDIKFDSPIKLQNR